MTRLIWGERPRFFDSGLDRGVLYLDGAGVPWNGLVSVNEIGSGEVDVDHYFDGNRIWITQETGDFEASITAYTYPDAFAEYNGYSERDVNRRFGFSYRTQHDTGYKLHIVYNAMIGDSDRQWSTVARTLDPSVFTWNLLASAVAIPGASPAARLTMEISDEDSIVSSIEDILYGTDTTAPRLPNPADLYELYESATQLRIRYNGDGTYSATGPDHMVRILADGAFELSSPSLFVNKNNIFTVSSI